MDISTNMRIEKDVFFELQYSQSTDFYSGHLWGRLHCLLCCLMLCTCWLLVLLVLAFCIIACLSAWAMPAPACLLSLSVSYCLLCPRVSLYFREFVVTLHLQTVRQTTDEDSQPSSPSILLVLYILLVLFLAVPFLLWFPLFPVLCFSYSPVVQQHCFSLLFNIACITAQEPGHST